MFEKSRSWKKTLGYSGIWITFTLFNFAKSLDGATHLQWPWDDLAHDVRKPVAISQRSLAILRNREWTNWQTSVIRLCCVVATVATGCAISCSRQIYRTTCCRKSKQDVLYAGDSI